MKLTINDIIILDEGKQVKKKLELVYGSLKKFYEAEDSSGLSLKKLYESKEPNQLSLKAIRNYCGYKVIDSRAFKLLLTEKLNTGWNNIVLSDVGQIAEYVRNVYYNILLYKQEADLLLFEKLIEYCNLYSLVEEKAILYRCIAKNYFYRDLVDKTVKYYNQAIGILSENHYYNTLIILHSEFAYHLFAERNIIEAEEHFTIATRLCSYTNISRQSLYVYNYRRGVILNSTSQYEKAREHFMIAFENAQEHNSIYSEADDALLAIGTTYKRQGNYEMAKDYYFKALLNMKEDDFSGRGSLINNIADIFCRIGEYEKATEYIEHSLYLLSKEGITNNYLLATETYAESMYKIGNFSGAYKYCDTLKKTLNTSINKRIIKNSICNVINMLDNMELLSELEKVLLYLISNTGNEIYKEDLYSCLGRLNIKLRNKEV